MTAIVPSPIRRNTLARSYVVWRSTLITVLVSVQSVQLSACAAGPTTEETEVSQVSHPLVSIPATSETTEKSGVQRWTFHALERSSALIGWGERDGDFKVISQLRISPTPDGGLELNYGRGHGYYIVDNEGQLVSGEVLAADLAVNAMFDHDLQAYGEQPYGCAGSILNGITGVVTALGTCAAVVPSIALTPLTPLTAAICAVSLGLGVPGGVIGIIEDCMEGQQRNYQVHKVPEALIQVDFCFGSDTCVTQPETVYFDEADVLQCVYEAPACG